MAFHILSPKWLADLSLRRAAWLIPLLYFQIRTFSWNCILLWMECFCDCFLKKLKIFTSRFICLVECNWGVAKNLYYKWHTTGQSEQSVIIISTYHYSNKFWPEMNKTMACLPVLPSLSLRSHFVLLVFPSPSPYNTCHPDNRESSRKDCIYL